MRLEWKNRKVQGREKYTFITEPPFEIQKTGNRGQRRRKKKFALLCKALLVISHKKCTNVC